MLAKKIPTPFDLVGWARDNYAITLDRLEPEDVGTLLYLAQRSPAEFQQLMTLGLKMRLKAEVGWSSNLIAQAIPAYITEARIKVALAVTLISCAGELPAIPLFSMSFLDECEQRILRECELLAFGRTSSEGGKIRRRGGRS